MRRIVSSLVTLGTGLALASAAQAAPARPATAYRLIDGGGAFTCAVTTAGAAKCWGQGFVGQLGDGAGIDRTRPVPVRGLTSGVVDISAGDTHACAVTTRGAVYCWGSNASGQLGDGTTNTRYVPALVRNLGGQAKSVTAGYQHTCALLTTGLVRCWGWNYWGQLGIGSLHDTILPATVKGLTSVTTVATMSNTTCAIWGAARLSCWGANGSRQIGDGTTTTRTAPRAVVGFGSGTRAVAPSVNFTCAVNVAGSAQCWGRGFSGELGDGSAFSEHFTPKPVLGLGSGVSSISTGATHAYAVLASGAARCWGENGAGSLGDGTTTDRYRPVAVKTLSAGVARVSAGGWHSCAVMSSGAASCWGANLFGQVGDGTKGTDRLVPTRVAG